MSGQVLPEEKVPEERAGTLSQRCVSDAYNGCSPTMLNFENSAVFMSSRFLKSLCPPSPGGRPGGPVWGWGWGAHKLPSGFRADMLSDSAGVLSSFRAALLHFSFNKWLLLPGTCRALGEWNR